MLHDNNDLKDFDTPNNGEFYTNHIVLDDGRKFELDHPNETQCILDDSTLCHFHNSEFDELRKRLMNCNEKDAIHLQRMLNASLPEKYISCVRQLLKEG